MCARVCASPKIDSKGCEGERREEEEEEEEDGPTSLGTADVWSGAFAVASSSSSSFVASFPLSLSL